MTQIAPMSVWDGMQLGASIRLRERVGEGAFDGNHTDDMSTDWYVPRRRDAGLADGAVGKLTDLVIAGDIGWVLVGCGVIRL